MGNLVEHSHCCGYLSWTPRPVPITDNKDYIRVLLYSHYTNITGWGFLLTDRYPTISGLSLGNHPNPKLGTSIAAHGPSPEARCGHGPRTPNSQAEDSRFSAAQLGPPMFKSKVWIMLGPGSPIPLKHVSSRPYAQPS